MFANYEFYKTDYGGSAIAETSFLLYGNRATAYLKSIISRVPEPPTQELKMAMCAVADEMLKDDAEHGGIQSESVGSWSRSYKRDLRSTQRKYFDAATLFLSSTCLVGRWI